MKVKKTTTQETFQPIELNITIESFDEYQAWKNMTVNCITNPKAMVNAIGLSHEYRDLISDAFSAIQRSPTDKFKYNIYAVDSDGDLLFCAASDLTFEKASDMVEVVNQEYYPIAPTPTEAVFIEIGGESKVYNITAK